MEEIDEEDFPRNVAPTNKSCIIELSDGSNDNDKDKDEGEAPKESEEAELGQLLPWYLWNVLTDKDTECLSKDWNSPVYAFFKPIASIIYLNDHHIYVFEYSATHCRGKGNGHMVHHYLDTGDAKSTSNLCKHAKICWGEDIVGDADKTKEVHVAREALTKMKSANGSITDTFERVAKAKVTYRHRQHTTTEAWWVESSHQWKRLTWLHSAEIVHWVAENKRPFQIVNDCGFQSLMKTGCPGYHIPSAETVSCDVKRVFIEVCKRIAQMLKVFY